jgi:hypothetical protein
MQRVVEAEATKEVVKADTTSFHYMSSCILFCFDHFLTKVFKIARRSYRLLDPL